MRTLLAFLLLASPAFAADMSVSIGGVTETWTLSSADQTKFDAWVQSAYKCTGIDCTPLTLAQAEVLWAQATLQGTIDNVTRWDKLQTAQQAVAEIPPITPMKNKRK